MISPKPQKRSGVWAFVAFVMLGFLFLHRESLCFTFQTHSQNLPEAADEDANIDDINNATLGVSYHIVFPRDVKGLTNPV